MTTVAQIATLAYGYTMAQVDDIARQATRLRPSRVIDAEEAAAVAWHAVVEALYVADQRPGRHELVNAGTRALSSEIKRLISYHGINAGRTKDQANSSAAPHFQKYWSAHHNAVDDDFTERIAERLALPTVLSVLTAKQYDVIATLAAFDGDITAAASALGMERPAYLSVLRRGRRQILAVWYEHETPQSKVRVIDPEKCYHGHDRAQHSHRDTLGRWVCRACKSKVAGKHCRDHRERKRVAAFAAE